MRGLYHLTRCIIRHLHLLYYFTVNRISLGQYVCVLKYFFISTNILSIGGTIGFTGVGGSSGGAGGGGMGVSLQSGRTGGQVNSVQPFGITINGLNGGASRGMGVHGRNGGAGSNMGISLQTGQAGGRVSPMHSFGNAMNISIFEYLLDMLMVCFDMLKRNINSLLTKMHII